jgi:hypothetical protein
MHTKHSNTVFPGDAVQVLKPGHKKASAETGNVVDVNPEHHTAKVAYPDGREEWVDLENMKKG